MGWNEGVDVFFRRLPGSEAGCHQWLMSLYVILLEIDSMCSLKNKHSLALYAAVLERVPD